MIEAEKPALEDLVHFGVKGMKWGVRKSEVDLSKFSSQESVLQKGSKVQNLTADAPRKLDKTIYVSHTPKDNLNYRGQFSLLLINRRHASSVYENVFVAKKDIRIPSERQSVEAFMTLYKQNPKRLLEDLASSQYDLAATQHMWGAVKGKKYYNVAVKAETKRLTKLGENFVASKEGHQALSGMLIKDLPSKAAYFQELGRQGFDAVVDEHDRQGGGQQPLIILNGKDVLVSGKSKTLSKKDIDLALLKFRKKYNT